MKNPDPLVRFETLLVPLAGDPPPKVNVAQHVMRRIRTVPAQPERTLEFLTIGSCAAALLAVLLGISLLTQMPDPLNALFDIVPPIGL